MKMQSKPLGGFRALTSDEIMMVSGGVDIVVVGNALQTIIDNNSTWAADLGLGTYGGVLTTQDLSYETQEAPNDDGAGAAEADLTGDQEDKIEIVVQGLIAVLQDNLRASPTGDYTLVFPGVAEFSAADLLDKLGKTLDFLEAGVLAYEIFQGNPDVIGVAAFLVAMGVGASVASSGPLAVFAASAIAGWATEQGLIILSTQIGTALREADARLDQAARDNSNPNYTPSQNLLIFLERIFNLPDYDDVPEGYSK